MTEPSTAAERRPIIRGVGTPRPWPEGALPNAEQMAEWLTRCTNAERVETCYRMLESAERASMCWIQDHEGRIKSAERQLEVARADIGDILIALGITDCARPISTHEVVQTLIVPSIKRYFGDDK